MSPADGAARASDGATAAAAPLHERGGTGTGAERPRSRELADDAESPYKSRGGPGRIVGALRYSMRGLVDALRIESAFRQELILAGVLVPTAIALRRSAIETLLLIGVVFVVLIVELVNSSIEAAVDRISLDHHRLSGRAKDLGSAAVFLALMLCLLTWVLLAGPALFAMAASAVARAG